LPEARREEAVGEKMRTRLASSKGVALVEFALIVFLLFIIVMGIIEFGLILYDKAVITNASREGARHGVHYRINSSDGSYNPYTNSEIETVVNNYVANRLVNFSSQGVSVTVSPDEGSRTASYRGQPLTVQVTYAYDFLVLPGLAPLLGETVDISAETIMRME
jgi:Flp pilus assembly protein TadG